MIYFKEIEEDLNKILMEKLSESKFSKDFEPIKKMKNNKDIIQFLSKTTILVDYYISLLNINVKLIDDLCEKKS